MFPKPGTTTPAFPKVSSTSGNLAMDDAARQTSAIAVLPTPASPTNSGLFFCRRHSTWMVRLISGFTADQRIDLAFARLLVEVDAIGVERVALLFRLVVGFCIGGPRENVGIQGLFIRHSPDDPELA